MICAESQQGLQSQNIRRLLCGFPARLRKKRCIVVLAGYADDSGSDGIRTEKDGSASGNIFLLAGFVASAERWEEFSDRFEDICNESPQMPDFHMAEAWRIKGRYKWRDEAQRDSRIRPLIELIKESAQYRVESVLAWPNYLRIVKGQVSPEIDNPYFLLFYNVILSIANCMDKADLEGTVDWVFDEQGKVGAAANNWYYFIRESVNENIRKRMGSTPIFRHDENVLPLKAADIYAWQVRRHLDIEQPRDMMPNDYVDSLLGIHGASNVITADNMYDFVWNLKVNNGLMLKSETTFFLPK